MDVFKTLLLDTPDSLNAITGTLQIANGGTGATDAAGARDNLLPDYTGNVGKVLTVNAGATDVEWTTNGSGTVTSVDLTAGTGVSVSGGPITSSGSITVTNTAPDQTVVLTAGTGINTSGTYPSFTVTNSAPDQTVVLTAGTGINTSGTYPSFTITNSAPDQTVAIAAGTGISVSGSYPSFTVTNSAPSLGGDVVGPASSTDNAIVRFDSTTGKLVQNSGVTISDADLLTTTDLTVNDDTVLGSSNTDTVTFNARAASDINPATDDTYDLGVTGHEWRNLNIDGTANIDSLVADTADINGGTIDGTAIGATTPSTVAATTLSASTSVTTPSVTNAGTLALSATGANILTAATNGSERMRIDSTGNVGIGNTGISIADSTTLVIGKGTTSLDDSGILYIRGGNGGGGSRDYSIESDGSSSLLFVDRGYNGGNNGTGTRMTLTYSTGLAVTGSLSCTGALSKGSGSFRIDHPLPSKSATHQLVHSFIEGPKADLIYRGKVALVGGKASVNIDAAATMTEGTFEVLCRDVQCFTTNETGWTAVRGKVTGNILTIEAEDADCADDISWMVIGERKDPHMMETEWTDENGRVIVEPQKVHA